MAGTTKYLTINDFEEQSTLNPEGSESIINGTTFRKGDTLENIRIKEVLDICNKYHNFNINTLIIKDKNYLTIWIEARQRDRSNDENPANLPPQDRSLPTKTITKRYRGQVYEETVVDWSAVQQMAQENKPRRKYRGQYID